MEVVLSTKGQNGELNAARTASRLLTCLLVRAANAIVGVAACEVLTHGERFATNTAPFSLPLSHIQRPRSELKRLG